MTYKQITGLYSLFITNVNRLTERFGRAYFPNPYIKDVYSNDRLDSVMEHFTELLSIEDYNKYEGFLFPVVLLDEGDSRFRIIDGCHRYAFTSYYTDYKILGIIVKDVTDFEMMVPVQICAGNYKTVYTFKVNEIDCAKIIISDVDSFGQIFVAFTELIYSEMKSNSEYFFKASKVINLNHKNINISYSTGDGFAPSFQYIDEFGIIRHNTMTPKEKSKEYIQAMYDMYVDNIHNLSNEQYIYLGIDNMDEVTFSNTEWWDHLSFDKESLIDSVYNTGIYLPIVYNESDIGIRSISDGLHRYFACREILKRYNTSYKRYLIIPNDIHIYAEREIYVPKLIYDRYSYVLKGTIKYEFVYENVLDCYIMITSDNKTVCNVRKILERELSDMIDKNMFKILNIKSAKFFNGGIL